MLRFAATPDRASGGDGPEVGKASGEEVSMDIRAVRITVALTVALVAGTGLSPLVARSSPPEPSTVAQVPTLKPGATRPPATPPATPLPLQRNKAMNPLLEEPIADRIARLERDVAALTKRVSVLESANASLSATVANDEKRKHKHCLPGGEARFLAAGEHSESPLFSTSTQVDPSHTCSK